MTWTPIPPGTVLAAGADARRVFDECPASVVDPLGDFVLVLTDSINATG